VEVPFLETYSIDCAIFECALRPEYKRFAKRLSAKRTKQSVALVANTHQDREKRGSALFEQERSTDAEIIGSNLIYNGACKGQLKRCGFNGMGVIDFETHFSRFEVTSDFAQLCCKFYKSTMQNISTSIFIKSINFFNNI